jgi:hypothetical protein
MKGLLLRAGFEGGFVLPLYTPWGYSYIPHICQSSGLEVETMHAGEMPKALPIVRPMIFGVARK